jgi:Armadillo/beta-catenin-like repeat
LIFGAVLFVDANKTAIGAKGGIELLLAAMRTHAASAPVMEQACGALWNLAVNGTIDIAGCKCFLC